MSIGMSAVKPHRGTVCLPPSHEEQAEKVTRKGASPMAHQQGELLQYASMWWTDGRLREAERFSTVRGEGTGDSREERSVSSQPHHLRPW